LPFHGSNRGSNPLGDAIPILRKAVAEARRLLFRRRRQRLLAAAAGRGMPSSVYSAAAFMIDRSLDRFGLWDVVSRAEARRVEISAQTDRLFTIWYSPKPQAASSDAAVGLALGQQIQLSAPRIAATGKDRVWGPALHLLVRESGVTRILELGACAGISALYMAQAANVQSIVTVEGSPELAALTAESLKSIGAAQVVNAQFTDAIELLQNEQAPAFDFVFIDGHHERLATIYYFDKVFPLLSPGAHVVFDDIRWSDDMFSAWRVLSSDCRFSHAIDFGSLGICVCRKDGGLGASTMEPTYWDLSEVVGRTHIGQPWGWR
jgi:predicted O-methyltransferase YrrM